MQMLKNVNDFVEIPKDFHVISARSAEDRFVKNYCHKIHDILAQILRTPKHKASPEFPAILTGI